MQPFITRRSNGEYSTVLLENGVIETVWFPRVGESVIVGRTWPQSIISAAQEHINSYEFGQ